ncbi:MAG: alpha/beta fold hydrolase, partial [Candidatus Binataceae bacterium]
MTTRRVTVGCGVVELADEGPEAGRLGSPPVVLLHGFTGSKESWRELREQLRATRRVVSLDLPGHGATEINGDRFQCSIESTARIVIEALDVLGIARFALVGYSMGGRLALSIALDYGARLERLVLESASAGIADPGERRQRQQADDELARFVESAGIEAFVNRWESMPLFESQRALAAEVRESV